nr:miz zinc finger family protein [Hymenolepis microstoma]
MCLWEYRNCGQISHWQGNLSHRREDPKRRGDESCDPRSRHLAENGFTEKKIYDEEIALYPPLREGQFILLKKETWPMEKNIDMVDFMDALLQLYVEDKENELIFVDEEISMEVPENVPPLSTSRRIELAEFERPRIFLAFFVDVYRVLLDVTRTCKSSAQFKIYPERCAEFFTSYDHVLATYTELICKYLTAFGHYDVDHICPNLCLPRGEPLWHPTEEHQKTIDVCGQILYAMPGTCRVYGKGIYDHEFVCECITSAYQWFTESGKIVLGEFPRCEPKDAEFEKSPSGVSKKFACSKSEFEFFCSISGSKECFFKNSRHLFQGKNMTVTKTSLWPTCICKEGYAGVRCDRRLNVCEDPLPITEKELKELKKKVRGLPSTITANWLCEGYLPNAYCLPDHSSNGKYKYRCECRKGSKRDLNYLGLDNCRLRSEIRNDYPLKAAVCPPGYAGDHCDRTINAWSKWSEWGECYPYCGSHRQRSKRRLCLGDFGCVGSLCFMNCSNNHSNLVPTNIVGSVARTHSVSRTPIAPNPSIPVPRFPTNTIPYGQLFLQNVTNPRLKNLPKDPNSIFTPGNKIDAIEFANFVMRTIRNPACQRALCFYPLSKVDSDATLLRAVNNEICSGCLFGIYSESPFLRPVMILRETKFAYPFNASPHFSDSDGLIRQLKDIADAKCNPHASPILCANPCKFSASNMGFATDFMTHSFNLELDVSLLQYLNEQSKREATMKGDQYRVVMRLGWATTPLIAFKTESNARRLLTADQLPRSLTIKVGRKQVPLPDPAFHGGQATKLGHRLRYSIDITDKLQLRPQNSNRPRNIEIEIGWVQAPLEDSGIALLDAVGTGLITPAINSLINLPLIQVTLDRVETVQRIVKSFVSAKPGVSTGEAEYQPQHPGPLGEFSLPPFKLDTVFGLYQFCVSPERVIPKQTTLKMLKSKLDNQDGIQCENSFPTSLNCPLTLLRIRIPVKSRICTHVQCFDLVAFLKSVKCRPRWNCPVCKIAVPFRDLRRDELFEELLQDPALSSVNQIKIDASGRVIYIENDHGESQKSQNKQDFDKKEILAPLKIDPCLPAMTQPKKFGSEEVIIIDDSSDEEQELQLQNRTNGETSSGFDKAPSIPSELNTTQPAGVSTEIQQQPPASDLNTLNNPPPPPRMGSPTLTQPPLSGSARPIVIPHRAPIISDEIVDLTSDNDDEFDVPTTRVEHSRGPTTTTSTASHHFSPPFVQPPTQPQPSTTVSAPPSTPRTPYLVIPPTSQHTDQLTKPALPGPATISVAPTVPNLAPRVITSLSSMEGARYVLVPTTQSNSGATLHSFPIPIQKSAATVNAPVAAVPAQPVIPPPTIGSNPIQSPHLSSLLSAGSPQSTTSTNASQDSTSGGTGGGSRSSRFKSTAKRRASNSLASDVSSLTGTGPSDVQQSQSSLSAISANLRTRTSARLSSSTIPSPVTTHSRNVARRGGGRSNAGGEKRRRVHLGDEDGSPSVASSSTGAPSEGVNFEDEDDENFDSNQEDEDDDSDDEWTPNKLNTSTSSSARRKNLPSAVTILARRKSTTSGAPSSEGSNSGSSRRT